MQQIFSINALAELLEKDRRTVQHALRRIKPDSHEGKNPRWRMRTAIDALAAHEQHITRQCTGQNTQTFMLIDEIEAEFKAFDVGFATLESEPDLEKRRKLDEKLGVGKITGSLDRKLKKVNAAVGEEDGLAALVSMQMVGALMSKYLTLLDYWPSDEKMEALKAEASSSFRISRYFYFAVFAVRQASLRL